MTKINIALFEPEIPQNTGNIARLCACCGASLYLVGKLGFSLSSKYTKRAGLDYWDSVDLHKVDTMDELYKLLPDSTFYYLTTKTDKLYTDIQFKDGDVLVFGPETRGLPETLIWDNPDLCVRIPMISDARSLNLSNSVAIMLYEALRQKDFSDLKELGMLSDEPDHIPRELL
jgi:tRNA (cytidine/uridine-2'-O-)-methyltransferase